MVNFKKTIENILFYGKIKGRANRAYILSSHFKNRYGTFDPYSSIACGGVKPLRGEFSPSYIKISCKEHTALYG